MNEGRRERKLAQTRLALVTALRDQLASASFEDIKVRALTDAADVSEATFFNYFRSKADLALYFIQLWSVDIATAPAVLRKQSPRASIEAIFAATAHDLATYPRVMGEIIAVQARHDPSAPITAMTALEKRVAFPDRPGVDQVTAIGLDGLLPPLIAAAKQCGELPRHVDDNKALLALVNVFFGVPLIFARRQPALIAALYQQQLQVVWAGLQAAPATGTKESL